MGKSSYIVCMSLQSHITNIQDYNNSMFSTQSGKQITIIPRKFHTHQQQLWSFYPSHVQHDQHVP